MSNFSSRQGLSPITPIQKESVNDALRNACWTVIYDCLIKEVHPGFAYDSATWRDRGAIFIRKIWTDFFSLAADSISWNPEKDIAYLKNKFYKFEWNKMYDFIEFFVSSDDNSYTREKLESQFNNAFRKEFSAYRFKDCQIIETTSKEEIL